MTHEQVNLSELFIEVHNDCLKKNKSNNGTIKKHTAQSRFLELLEFVDKSCIWTRHNLLQNLTGIYDESLPKNYIEGKISGKYLNELHLFFCKHNLYEILYKRLLDIYFEITDYQTLKFLSNDSCFIRNINGKNCYRNPRHNNKPGFHVHALVDTLRTPISFSTTSCVTSDASTIDNMFDNLFVPIDLLKKIVKIY